MNSYRPHLLAFFALVLVLLAGVHTVFRNTLTDLRFRAMPREASGDIVLVAIDARSIQTIGTWPWPRRYHADLIDRLTAAGATDIVFDVDFSSPSTPDADHALTDALRRADGSIILPLFKQWVDGTNGRTIHVNRPLPQLDAHSWPAIVNVTVEPDGLVRRYAFGHLLEGDYVPSVGLLLAGGHARMDAPFWIDFGIRVNSLPTVSYVDALEGHATALDRIRGKKVVIGATAIELGDRFSVPNGQVIAGPQLQMLAAESIRQGRTLRATSPIVTIGGLAVIVLLMALLWRRSSASIRVLVLIALAIVVELGAMLLQARYAVILDTSLWQLAIVAYLIALALDEIAFRSLLGGIAERRFQQIAMTLGDGLVCIDPRGRITVWNAGAEAMFGFRADEMIGKPLNRVCSRPDSSGQPLAIAELSAPKVGSRVMELEGRRRNGERFPIEACFSGWQGVDGQQLGAVMRDISERIRESERIRHLAEHDTLTGLANRHSFHEHLGAQLGAVDTDHGKVALLLLDLDKFKQVNDTLGHACGDQLLCAVAQRLTELTAADGLPARLSGDEFAIVVGGPDAPQRAEALARRASAAFARETFAVGTRRLRINASIGVAVYPDHCTSADELFGNADLALYRAKGTGRGRYVMFERGIRDELEAQLSLEAELAHAVERGELELFYQPQIALADGALLGAEALIRWRHPTRGIIAPADFMPLVNASSISNRIAPWVLESACRQGSRWQRQGHDVCLGVNLSPSQLQSGDLAAAVAKVLDDTGLHPNLLELEVTENILLEDDEAALDVFRRIRNLGVKLALDDFGTGYASLTYLKRFPLDRLKIDRSFVRGMLASPDDAAIVGCTINLGKLLGLAVIAEGIEDAATADVLVGMGCEQGQGYHFGPPMTVAQFEQVILSTHASRRPVAALAPNAA